MQGSILSAAMTSNQGVILGDDGVRYTFTPAGWLDSSTKAVVGMRVSFEAQGGNAVGVSQASGVSGQAAALALEALSERPPHGDGAPATPQLARPPEASASREVHPSTPGPTAPQTPDSFQNVVSRRSLSIQDIELGRVVTSLMLMSLLTLFMIMIFLVIAIIVARSTEDQVVTIITIIFLMIGASAIGIQGGRIAGGIMNAIVSGLIASIVAVISNFITVQVINVYIQTMPFTNEGVAQGAILTSLVTALPLLFATVFAGGWWGRR